MSFIRRAVLLSLLVGTSTEACSSQSDCSSTQVCVDGACIASIATEMLDRIAEFATGNPAATYASTTSSTFEDLFQCTIGNTNDELLLKQQHFLWKGFVDYFVNYDNHIVIEESNGGSTNVVDEWGDRCETQQGCTIDVDRYSECADATSCVPKDLLFPVGSQQVQVDIYEPCGFTSNLAYYRVMSHMCGPGLFMNISTSNALIHAYAALAAGSANWHASHTYLGYQADNQLIAVVAFLVHQLVVGDGLAAANGLAPNDIRTLYELSTIPRTKTAVAISQDVTDTVIHKNVLLWTSFFKNLDVPSYFETFTAIIASVATVLFPDKPETMSTVLDGLASAFGADTTALNVHYLPKMRDLATNVNLSESAKFALFRMLFGTFGKFVFAFLWQEQVLQIDFFLKPKTNELAPKVMPAIISLFNFISGLEHSDTSFQELVGVFPGDEQCRKTVPHSKWHEVSAMGLLDLTYMADCVAAAVNGNTGGCAHLNSLAGPITRADIIDWAESIFGNVPIIKYILPVFIADVFLLFDFDEDDQIEWSDIVRTVETAEAVADIVTTVSGKIEDFFDMFDNFCYADSGCDSTSEFCNTIRFGCQPKRDNGFFPCLKDSQCFSDRCVDTTRVCSDKLDDGQTCFASKSCKSGLCAFSAGVGKCGNPCSSGCSSGEWCNKGYSPDICRPLRPNGWGPCLADAQCESGRCVDTTRVCARKKNRGERCASGKECLSGSCRWFKCR